MNYIQAAATELLVEILRDAGVLVKISGERSKIDEINRKPGAGIILERKIEPRVNANGR